MNNKNYKEYTECPMSIARIYPLYIQKVEKKGRTKDELDAIIFWADRI